MPNAILIRSGKYLSSWHFTGIVKSVLTAHGNLINSCSYCMITLHYILDLSIISHPSMKVL